MRGALTLGRGRMGMSDAGNAPHKTFLDWRAWAALAVFAAVLVAVSAGVTVNRGVPMIVPGHPVGAHANANANAGVGAPDQSLWRTAWAQPSAATRHADANG